MKAIILAAGFGGRMRPLTDHKPKAMLEIAGQTIIERIINSLVKFEITKICIVTGYLKEVLEEYLLKKFPNVEFTFVFNEIYQKTNNIYSMHLAFEKFNIDQDVLLIESDLVFKDEVLEKIIYSENRNVALVDKFKIGMDGTVVAVDNDLIASIIPPHLQGPNFDFSDKYKTLNIYKFSLDFIQTSFRKLLSFYATTYNDNCYYELILGILVYMQHEKIHACDVNGEKWFEVDDVNDVRLAEIIFNDKNQIDLLDKAFGGFWNMPIIDFAFIRNMYFPNDSMLSDIKYNFNKLLHNYCSTQKILNEKLSHFLLMPQEKVCLMNGASQAFPILSEILKGKTALMPQPTFGEYERIFQKKNYYKDDGFSSLNEHISPDLVSGCDVVVFVNPNNPTGSFFRSSEIVDFAKQWEDKLIIVDESFVEFTLEPSVQDALADFSLKNILIVKSLSKSLGIPGVRLGYVASNNLELVAEINSKIPIWNANSTAEYFLEIILKHRKSLAESFQLTVKDRDELADGLSRLSCVERVYSSGADFLLVKLNLEKGRLREIRSRLLHDWQIYIKDVSSKFFDHSTYVRLAIRLPKENKKLLEALRKETQECL